MLQRSNRHSAIVRVGASPSQPSTAGWGGQRRMMRWVGKAFQRRDGEGWVEEKSTCVFCVYLIDNRKRRCRGRGGEENEWNIDMERGRVFIWILTLYEAHSEICKYYPRMRRKPPRVAIETTSTKARLSDDSRQFGVLGPL